MLRGVNAIKAAEAEKNKKAGTYDAGIGAAFVAAIAVLLFVAGYVINRLSKERTYREKWKDYNDCGWA